MSKIALLKIALPKNGKPVVNERCLTMNTKLHAIRHPVGLLLILLGFLLTACQLNAEPSKEASQTVLPPAVTLYVAPHLFEADDGRTVSAEWGHLLVPENRMKSDSRFIEIPFIRFRAVTSNPATPTFYLQGGPGDESLAIAQNFLPFVPTLPFDLILVEQRGIGYSRPRLDCPGFYNLPLDRPLDFESLLKADLTYYEGCVNSWKSQGVDLSGYNTREMAADVDALRQALGYEQINLMGGSFGSHHGLAILKFFGDHVDRAVLSAVEGPNHTIKLPSTVQQHLEKLDSKVKDDMELSQDIPNLLELMASVLDQLAQKPITWQITDPETEETVSVTLGKFDLQVATAHGLGKTAFLRALPSYYHAMSQGNFSWLAQWAVDYRTDRGGNLMGTLVDCASGATAERRQRIEKEATETLLGDAINHVQFDRCEVLGQIDLGDDFRADLQSEKPVLFISGSLDARTPVSNAEAVLTGLAQGQHLILDGVSHDFELGDDLFLQYIQATIQFLMGEPLATTQIVAPFTFDPLTYLVGAKQ